MNSLETVYLLDSSAEIDDFKISQNYLLTRSKKHIQMFELISRENSASKYRRIGKRQIEKKILQIEINNCGVVVSR